MQLSFLELLSKNSLWAIRISGRAVRAVTLPSKTGEFHRGKKPLYARSRTTRGSAVFSQQCQHFSGDLLRERHGDSPGERRVGGSAAPPARRGRKRPPPARPAASRRLGGVTSRGVSGTYVTPRGRRRCCFSPFLKTNSFPRPPTPSVPWDKPASAAVASFPRSCPPRRLPPSLPAGRGAAPAPRRDSGAQRRLPPGSSFPPPGSPRFPTWPRENGQSPGEEGLRKESFPLAPRPAPTQANPPAAWNTAGRRCSPGTPRSGRRLPYSPHGRGHTPRAGGRAPGHRPAGRGRRHLGREGRAPRPRAAHRAALSGREGRGRSAHPDPAVAPRGRGILQAGQLPRGGEEMFFVDDPGFVLAPVALCSPRGNSGWARFWPPLSTQHMEGN